MEQLPNEFTLNLPEGAFPLSTDSMVLSHFVRLPKNARVLDLGSGCGTLGLLLCAVNESCRVTGVELSQSAHLAAIDNIRRNGLTTRMESICVDVRQVPGSFPPGSFDVCVSNPPYFSGGPASRTAALARREDACSPADLFRAAAWTLKYGGDFFLVRGSLGRGVAAAHQQQRQQNAAGFPWGRWMPSRPPAPEKAAPIPARPHERRRIRSPCPVPDTSGRPPREA